MNFLKSKLLILLGLNVLSDRSLNLHLLLQTILKNWISLFGYPEQISKHLIDLCENFNIKILTTPAESSWSNGWCERHNKILTDMLFKIKVDTSCSWKIALAWALNAKSSLINVSGFSPHQLVFGKNIKITKRYEQSIICRFSRNKNHWRPFISTPCSLRVIW